MATLTVAIDSEILEAARLEAERRKTSLDQVIADSLAAFVHCEKHIGTDREENRRKLLELMYSSPLGVIDRPLTREEIYAERSWPRS